MLDVWEKSTRHTIHHPAVVSLKKDLLVFLSSLLYHRAACMYFTVSSGSQRRNTGFHFAMHSKPNLSKTCRRT